MMGIKLNAVIQLNLKDFFKVILYHTGMIVLLFVSIAVCFDMELKKMAD